MKNEYKEEIKKLNNYQQLDYNIIRKLLTIDGHYSTECEFTTPSDLLKREFALYDMMLKEDTIRSIKTLYNTDVNTFLFSYSIVRNAKKAFLRAIDFNNNYQEEKNDPSMKDKFNKFFKYEIKYVIVIQNFNIKVIRVNNNTIVKDLQTINDNDFQVILYFVKQEAIPKQIEKPKEEITPKELEQHNNISNEVNKKIAIEENNLKKLMKKMQEIKRNNCRGQNINNNTKVKSNDTITKMTVSVLNPPIKIFVNLANIDKVFAPGHSTEDINGKFK